MKKLVRVATLATAVPLFALLVAVPANASTGGGCANIEDYGQACVSADGSDVVADFYITNPPPTCQSVRIDIWDFTLGTNFEKKLNGCSNGHYGWYTETPNADGLEDFPGTNGDHYQSDLIFFVAGGEAGGYSPDLLFTN